MAAGTGHNGGDGWVLARALHRLDVPVWVTALAGTPAPLTRAHGRRSRAPRACAKSRPTGRGPRSGSWSMRSSAPVRSGAPRAPAAALLERLLDLELPDPRHRRARPESTSAPAWCTASPRADVTVTFGGFRRGHLLARDEVGDLVVVDIGHPPARIRHGRCSSPTRCRRALAAAARVAITRATRGRIVVIGGDAGMSGAARLAGARRVRRGRRPGARRRAARDASPPSAPAEPDLQTLRASDSSATSSGELRALLERADAVVIGPGLGRGDGQGARSCWRAPASRSARCSTPTRSWRSRAGWPSSPRSAPSAPLVLTPHAGEFRTLFPRAGARSATPTHGARRPQRRSSRASRVLLKGVPTVIARAGRSPLTVAAGNPGLATGGSGDVLSGILGALLARGGEPEVAAAVAAQALGPRRRPRGAPGDRACDAADGRDRGAARPLARVGRDAPAHRRTRVEPPVLAPAGQAETRV